MKKIKLNLFEKEITSQKMLKVMGGTTGTTLTGCSGTNGATNDCSDMVHDAAPIDASIEGAP